MGKKNAKDELVLFEQVKAGKLKSFEILFDRYYQSLCNYSYLFLKNEELSEEIVCDVFINIWNKRSEINIYGNVKSYLYKSTKNAVISQVRKKHLNLVYDFEDKKIESFNTPETLLLSKELDENVDKLLNGIPKKAGLVFRMKRIDGLKYKEIADILNISEKTVENHITKAIKKIRTILEQNPEIKKYFSN